MTSTAGAITLPCAAEDYSGGDYLQDIYEAALIEIGGQSLLEDAQDEACAYVDQHYPWDGRGDEPAERVSAYCAVPWQRADLARSGTEAT